MIYINKIQPRNLSLYKQKDPSFLTVFKDYDKHKLKKKAGFYFRMIIKEKIYAKKIPHKKVQKEKELPISDSKILTSSRVFSVRNSENKNQLFECKFYEDVAGFTSRSRRIVGYTSHGDLFTRHF